MILHRLDDYQSWLVTHDGAAILVDPWLTAEPISGSFDRRHGAGFTTVDEVRGRPERVVAILLCAGVNDHTRPLTLEHFTDVPIHGPIAAAKVARRAGCSSTHVTRIGHVVEIPADGTSSFRITPTATGRPLGLIANGYLVEALRDGDVVGRLWIEPHQPTIRVAEALAPVDVTLLPTTSVTAVVLPVTAGLKRSLRATAACGSPILVPTATDPRRDMTWWQKTLYTVRHGRTSRLRTAVESGRVHELGSGDHVVVGTI